MGNADGMSRRGNDSDFYSTPPMCVHEIAKKFLVFDEANGDYVTILDPCCGTGVIGNVLRQYSTDGTIIVEEDILNGQNFLERKEDREFWFVVMNPPYSKKNEFILKAMKVAYTVVCILPLNVINYNSFQKNFLDIPEYIGRYVMRPKFFMAKNYNGQLPRRGGISSYAWFMWDKNNNTDRSWEKYIDLEPYFN